MKHDPIEDTPEYKAIEEELEAEIEKELAKMDMSHSFLGKCHIYWSIKERILKEKYNIEWKSPSALNPHIMFD